MCENCAASAAVVRIIVRSGEPKVFCLICAAQYVREALPRARLDPVRFWTYFANPHVFAGSLEVESLPADSACPQCGLNFAEFTRVGLAGCSGCYSAFETVILPALFEIHTAPGP